MDHKLLKTPLLIIAFSGLKTIHAQNVGIGTTTPTRAGLVVTQKAGETFALFGSDGNSTSITGSFLNNNAYASPTIGFNLYHNNGDKRLQFAHAGKILYDQIEGDFHFLSSEAGAPNVSITEYKKPLTIYNSGNVLIGATGAKSAGLMVTQKFGETLAIFGTEGNSTSITGSFLNNNVYRSPSIGFNMYHNNGDKRVAFAHAGKILYDQIEGNFHFLSSEAGAPDVNITDYKMPLSIFRNGYVAVGATSNNPFLGGLTVNSKIGGNNAVFGSNTTGVSIESDFPGIGLNSYFNITRRHINNGYAGLIGLNPVNGNFYVLSSEVAATAFESSAFNTRFLINNAGNIGIQGNTNPRVPLSFAASLGNKLGLWVNNAGAHYGFGIQASLLQMYTPANTDDIAFGVGNSEAFTENVRIKGNGNMGIGTNNPQARLHVNGSLRLVNGTEGNRRVLTSDANGVATWQNLPTVQSFAAILPAGQNLTAGDEFVVGNMTEVFDEGNIFTTNSNQFVAPATGIYHIDLNLLISSSGSTGIIQSEASIRVNGSGLGQSRMLQNTPAFSTGSGFSFSLHYTRTLKLTMGDVVTYYGRVTGNGSFVLRGGASADNASSLSIIRLQ
ncbi:MAG: hypothetical protein EAY75_15485 [Bacteroidetes bacterium]|nr:MAG: hypothetical protein EAY75_15485 [Bacteroidota bacterium]